MALLTWLAILIAVLAVVAFTVVQGRQERQRLALELRYWQMRLAEAKLARRQAEERRAEALELQAEARMADYERQRDWGLSGEEG